VGPRELIGKLEGREALDGVSDRIAGFVNSTVKPAKSLLSGTWLEHPLHPLLTDLPIGCWSGAVILDLFGGSGAVDAVDPLVGLGALAAVPAAVSGLSDWADSYGPERRVGLVHAAANLTGLGLFAASLMAGHRSARRLRLLGLAAVSAGGTWAVTSALDAGSGSTTRPSSRSRATGLTPSMRTGWRRPPRRSPRRGALG